MTLVLLSRIQRASFSPPCVLFRRWYAVVHPPKEEKKPHLEHTAKRRAGLIDVEPVKGTRDFAPEDMRVRNWLFDQFRTVSHSFAFHEYDAPILESEELYTRKGGEEITEQVYNFTDKAGRAIALRPEMTPSLARIVLKMGTRLAMPLKWFSIPQCWRFEQTVKGRKREHYQWNMDIIGVPNVLGEVELLATIVEFCKLVGLTKDDVGIRISNRKLLQTLLERMGVTGDQFTSACVAIDKFDKLPKSEFYAELSKLGIAGAQIERLFTFLDAKDLDSIAEMVGREDKGVQELVELFGVCKSYGFGEWIEFDPKIVRGLAYYTGVVFEAFAKTGTMNRAICGGGRYDKLFDTYGATAKESHPACGFGFGDCVILEILKEKNLIPKSVSELTWIQDVVTVQNPTMMHAAVEVAQKLRRAGRSVDLILNNKNLGWSFSYADKIGANRVVLIKEETWKEGKVTVKYMRETNADKKEVLANVDNLVNIS
eukprot:Phypoly_transcript_08347.p1 GENE.Phypoly_transcript_08347~~Phypoly_transcript_08347.p1  ORF type:complete len:509 (+),score=90.65 Phypoly_transcript_08347:76-1527(+)